MGDVRRDGLLGDDQLLGDLAHRAMGLRAQQLEDIPLAVGQRASDGPHPRDPRALAAQRRDQAPRDRGRHRGPAGEQALDGVGDGRSVLLPLQRAVKAGDQRIQRRGDLARLDEGQPARRPVGLRIEVDRRRNEGELADHRLDARIGAVLHDRPVGDDFERRAPA